MKTASMIAAIALACLLGGCEEVDQGDTYNITSSEGSTQTVQINNAEGTNTLAGVDQGD